MATIAGRNSRAAALPLPQKSLAAVTAATTGTAFDFGATYSDLALQVTVTGTTTNVKVILQGCLSTGAGYANIAGSTWSAGTLASGAMLQVTGKPVRYLRAVDVLNTSTGSIVNAWIGVAP